MKIAVYAIALNEIKNVERFMQACKGADLVVIADTGSSDGTPERFRELGAIVHHIKLEPFRFDDARNAALNLVPSDVDICVSLDIDEVPEQDFFDLIHKNWKEDTTRAWVVWDTSSRWLNNNRVHQRFGYRWIKPCHEVTVKYPPIGEKEIIIDTVVKHQPDDSKPRNQYLPLLQMAVAEDPSDARMRAYLIREYYFHNRWEDVVYETEKLFTDKRVGPAWDVESAAACRGCGNSYVKLGDKNKALSWFVKGTKEAPKELEPWFALAFFYYEEKMWQECFDAANKVNELDKGTHYLIDDTVWGWRCYDLLAISSWNLGKKGSAKKWARLAVEGCKETEPDYNRLKENYTFMLKGQK